MTDPKLRAAREALTEVDALGPGPHVIGLGSGSTATLFIRELAARVRAGAEITGVPTSNASRALAASLGIPLLDDAGPWTIDLTVDGADEVSEKLDLIKGGGGAHTREKIVNQASLRNVIVVDASKLSTRLGEKWPVPVEILRFAHRSTVQHLERLGDVTLRDRPTDADNLIADVKTGPTSDPAALDEALRAIPGVVETGLFVRRADVVIVATDDGVRRLRAR